MEINASKKVDTRVIDEKKESPKTPGKPGSKTPGVGQKKNGKTPKNLCFGSARRGTNFPV